MRRFVVPLENNRHEEQIIPYLIPATLNKIPKKLIESLDENKLRKHLFGLQNLE